MEGGFWGIINSSLSQEQNTVSAFFDATIANRHSPKSTVTLAIRYPFNHSIFPPEFIPPDFFWSDSLSPSDLWIIEAQSNQNKIFRTLTSSPPITFPVIDSLAIPQNSKMEIPDPNRYHHWTPTMAVWEKLKTLTPSNSEISLTIFGINKNKPKEILSQANVTFMFSKDSVIAPIFYRDVPIMPAKNESGRVQPLPQSAQRLVSWSLRNVGLTESKTIIKTLPTCANCHSFSQDGKSIGLDMDGPQSDKGTYGIAQLEPETDIKFKDVFSWNYDFKQKAKDKKTIGFLSRLSPDGNYVVSTVNEEVYIQNFMNNKYIQVFFPTRGILAVYSKTSHNIQKLPGTDDTAFVHCDPVWSPDGKFIVFARAKAKAPYSLGQKEARFPNDTNETQIKYDLYRIPFNDGKGGKPVPILGASENGLSNNFPKVTPDGKFIVFVKCKNGQLLRPDSRLWIVPVTGGIAREMNCNTSEMNSWHSVSPNGRWMVFSSKYFSFYTQMFLTHIDENGMDTPPILIPNATAANRAVNLPEFVNIPYDRLNHITASAVAPMQYMQDVRDLLSQGDGEGALKRMQSALALEKRDLKFRSEAQMLLGWIYKSTDSGIVWCRQAIQTDPKNALAHFNLGGFYEQKGNIRESLKYYTLAVELDPQNSWALMKLSKFYMKSEDPKIKNISKGIAFAEKSNQTSHFREPSLIKSLARAYSDVKRFKEAIDMAQMALELAREQSLSQEISELESELPYYQHGVSFTEAVKQSRNQ